MAEKCLTLVVSSADRSSRVVAVIGASASSKPCDSANSSISVAARREKGRCDRHDFGQVHGQPLL